MMDRASKRLGATSTAKKRQNEPGEQTQGRPAKRRTHSEQHPVCRQGKRRAQTQEYPRAKRSRTVEFNCTRGHPVRPGRPSKVPCRICGYSCDPRGNNFITLTCCGKACHTECWKAQQTKRKLCKYVRTFLKKDRITPNPEAVTTARVTADPSIGLSCDLCDIPLDKNEPLDGLNGHYMSKCTEIPGTPLKSTPTNRQTMRRVAALGLVKRVGKIDRVMRTRTTSNLHITPTTQSSPTPSVHVSESHPTVVADDP